MPRQLRLLKVTPEGYLVGTGEQRPQNSVLVPHEVAVAILSGLAEDKPLALSVTANDEQGAYILADAARIARRSLAGIAWRLGVCSWNSTWRAIPHESAIFQKQSE